MQPISMSLAKEIIKTVNFLKKNSNSQILISPLLKGLSQDKVICWDNHVDHAVIELLIFLQDQDKFYPPEWLGELGIWGIEYYTIRGGILSMKIKLSMH
jgi:hypothetical protein